MAQTIVLIDYDSATGEIRRIIHPEDDSQIVHHGLEPDWERVEAPHDQFPLNEDGSPNYGLDRCQEVVDSITGGKYKRVK